MLVLCPFCCLTLDRVVGYCETESRLGRYIISVLPTLTKSVTQ
jgi:hypothetical protein